MTPTTPEPLVVKYIETPTGSRISADLLVLVEPGIYPPEDMGLMEIIEAQIEAMASLERKLADAARDPVKEDDDLKEWADQFPHLVEDLCLALGMARNPVGPTGIRELDIILDLMR